VSAVGRTYVQYVNDVVAGNHKTVLFSLQLVSILAA